MRYFSKLERTAHYKTKNQNTVKTNCAHTRSQTHTRARTHARTHTHTHTHTHTRAEWIGSLGEVRFQRWFKRWECVWWSNFAKEIVQSLGDCEKRLTYHLCARERDRQTDREREREREIYRPYLERGGVPELTMLVSSEGKIYKCRGRVHLTDDVFTPTRVSLLLN